MTRFPCILNLPAGGFLHNYHSGFLHPTCAQPCPLPALEASCSSLWYTCSTCENAPITKAEYVVQVFLPWLHHQVTTVSQASFAGFRTMVTYFLWISGDGISEQREVPENGVGSISVSMRSWSTQAQVSQRSPSLGEMCSWSDPKNGPKARKSRKSTAFIILNVGCPLTRHPRLTRPSQLYFPLVKVPQQTESPRCRKHQSQDHTNQICSPCTNPIWDQTLTMEIQQLLKMATSNIWMGEEYKIPVTKDWLHTCLTKNIVGPSWTNWQRWKGEQ